MKKLLLGLMLASTATFAQGEINLDNMKSLLKCTRNIVQTQRTILSPVGAIKLAANLLEAAVKEQRIRNTVSKKLVKDCEEFILKSSVPEEVSDKFYDIATKALDQVDPKVSELILDNFLYKQSPISIQKDEACARIESPRVLTIGLGLDADAKVSVCVARDGRATLKQEFNIRLIPGVEMTKVGIKGSTIVRPIGDNFNTILQKLL